MNLLDFYIMHFHHIQIAIPSHRYFRLALTVAKQIVLAEKNPNKEYEQKLKWIEANTTEKLLVPLATIQLSVLGAPLNKEIPIVNNNRRTIAWKPLPYIRELYLAYEEVCEIVTKVAKKYSLDIPFGDNQYGGQSGYMLSQG